MDGGLFIFLLCLPGWSLALQGLWGYEIAVPSVARYSESVIFSSLNSKGSLHETQLPAIRCFSDQGGATWIHGYKHKYLECSLTK